jgi:hypothetical protein
MSALIQKWIRKRKGFLFVMFFLSVAWAGFPGEMFVWGSSALQDDRIEAQPDEEDRTVFGVTPFSSSCSREALTKCGRAETDIFFKLLRKNGRMCGVTSCTLLSALTIPDADGFSGFKTNPFGSFMVSFHFVQRK